jgi:hypothetical protein
MEKLNIPVRIDLDTKGMAKQFMEISKAFTDLSKNLEAIGEKYSQDLESKPGDLDLSHITPESIKPGDLGRDMRITSGTIKASGLTEYRALNAANLSVKAEPLSKEEYQKLYLPIAAAPAPRDISIKSKRNAITIDGVKLEAIDIEINPDDEAWRDVLIDGKEMELSPRDVYKVCHLLIKALASID